MKKIISAFFSVVIILAYAQTAGAQMACSEALLERASDELRMGLKDWNRIRFDDGSELGITLLHVHIDHGFLDSYSLRGSFYFSHLFNGSRENAVMTPIFQKFEYSDLGVGGKYLTIMGPKSSSGARLVVKFRISKIDLQTGQIKFSSVTLENEVSNGFLRARSRQPLATYSINNINSVFASPVKQLGPIEVSALTGSMSGEFALPD
ncbi:MAG TPA: hypothetical protein VN132_13370 [Bdellovibrio sp.]|nr:hypothetical protein [Bdellovibrio sp.]